MTDTNIQDSLRGGGGGSGGRVVEADDVASNPAHCHFPSVQKTRQVSQGHMPVVLISGGKT